jgi:putative intracellular protease/amidase
MDQKEDKMSNKFEGRPTISGLPRREFLKTGVGAALSIGLLAGAPVQRASSNVVPGKWICPPCGLDCDKLVFDKPGTCPQCGMTLIPLDGEGRPPKVSILIFNGAEIIDFSGPWEAFGTAGFLVNTVAEKMEPHTMVFGQKLMPDFTFDNAPKSDVLLIPGGGVGQHLDNARLIGWIVKKSEEVDHVMSVCTGAQLLAKTGLLDGQRATITYGMEEVLKRQAPKVEVVYPRRYVESGKFITTAGLTSGIDGALYLISKMAGQGAAQSAALSMEYNWQPDGKYSRAALADRYLPDGLRYANSKLGSSRGTVVSTAGGPDHWEMKLMFLDPKSPADLIKLLSERVRANTSHIQAPVLFNTSASSNEASWKFKDDSGNSWQAKAFAEAKDNDKALLTVSLVQTSKGSGT